MTHDELLEKIKPEDWREGIPQRDAALRAVVELHKNYRLDGIYYECSSCGKSTTYCPTIQAIEKELG
jgi:hypothetical protein